MTDRISVCDLSSQVCVHVVVNSRKFDTIPKSAMHALVPNSLFVGHTVAPRTYAQGPSKKSRCNVIFNSSTSAASTVAVTRATLRPFPQTGALTAPTMVSQAASYDGIVGQRGIIIHTGNKQLAGILAENFKKYGGTPVRSHHSLSGPPFSLTHDLKKVFRKRERKPSPSLVGKAWRVLVMIGIQSEWKTGEEDPIEAGGCGMSSYVPPRVTS